MPSIFTSNDQNRIIVRIKASINYSFNFQNENSSLYVLSTLGRCVTCYSAETRKKLFYTHARKKVNRNILFNEIIKQNRTKESTGELEEYLKRHIFI